MYTVSFIREADQKIVYYNEADLIRLYLDYVNNFLTIDVFASYYGFNRYEAAKVIDIGRQAHETSVANYKKNLSQV